MGNWNQYSKNTGGGIESQEEGLKDALEDLFLRSDEPEVDDTYNELESPTFILNLEEVNSEATRQANLITERLSGYYFDQKYIDKHPYIPSKIAQEMDNIRRLLKMLAVNERAQDSLIQSITINSGKGSLYGSLTSLQNSTLSIQKQLNELTSSLENIFREMQEECEQSFQEKDKETGDDGSVTVRGSRDFIKRINEQYNKTNLQEQQNNQIELTI